VKYVQFYTVPSEEDPSQVNTIEFVKTEDVPNILFGVFFSQPDKAYMNPAKLALKLAQKGSVLYENKRIIEHILDHVWV